MYFNCRSLLSKIDELAALCVETWLSVDDSDSEVAIHNYSLVRLDRSRHGSGVAVYVCNCVFNDVALSGPAELELVIVSLYKSGFKLCLDIFIDPLLPLPLF